MKEEQLNEKIFDVAEELNQVLGLDPEIQTENVTVADVKSKVTEAAELIDSENDEFSKTTTKVLQTMGLIADDSAHNEDVLESTNPQPEVESKEEAEKTEEEYEEEEPEEPEESLVDQVNAAKKRKQLKQIVSDNPEVFADVKAEMKNLKDASSLKEAMLEVLEGSSETSAPSEPEVAEKPEPKKEKSKVGKKVSKPKSGSKTAETVEYLTPFIEEEKYTEKELINMAAENINIAWATAHMLIAKSKNPKYNKFKNVLKKDSETGIISF